MRRAFCDQRVLQVVAEVRLGAKAARKFNEIYKPKNPMYCAGQTCQFMQNGTLQNEAILEVAQQPTQEQTKGESPVDILVKMQENFPEVYAVLLASKKN